MNRIFTSQIVQLSQIVLVDKDINYVLRVRIMLNACILRGKILCADTYRNLCTPLTRPAYCFTVIYTIFLYDKNNNR